MPPQLAIPSADVWNRIEKILDEQEYKKKYTNKIIADSFRSSKNVHYFVTALTGLSLLAFVMLTRSVNCKNN